MDKKEQERRGMDRSEWALAQSTADKLCPIMSTGPAPTACVRGHCEQWIKSPLEGMGECASVHIGMMMHNELRVKVETIVDTMVQMRLEQELQAVKESGVWPPSGGSGPQ